MKRLLFTDLHFHPHEPQATVIDGENSRLLDAVSVAAQIKHYALTNNIVEIDCLGDLFHTRKKIDIGVYDILYTILEDYKKSGLHLNLLAGNHDIYYRNSAQVTALRPLSKFAHVINTPELHTYNGVRFAYIPYYEKVDQLVAEIQKLPAEVYLLHAEYIGAQKSYSAKDIAKHGLSSDVFPSNVKCVLMGHYHRQQILSQSNPLIMYLGSPLQISTREIYEDKYFYELDTESLALKQIRTECARFAVVEFPSEKILKFYDAMAKIEDVMKGNYVEVVMNEPIKKSSEFFKKLQTSRNYFITNKFDKKTKHKVLEAEVSLDTLDIVSLSEMYLKDHPSETLELDFLKSVRDKIIA